MSATGKKRRVTLKGVALVVCVIVLLALNWTALNDITTGSDESHLSEWSVVFVTLGGIVVGALVGLRRRKR
ncbi:MAG: hypothetical protein JSW71_16655 [Gemmatimonadota bacterium]|nr:MAG: hypothetical protein JSW71_16655 [Gemmatimonadota bacterium]